MATRAIVPRANLEGNFGNQSYLWRNIFANELHFSDGTYMTTAGVVGSGLISTVWSSGWLTGYMGLSEYSGSHSLGIEPKFSALRIKAGGSANGYSYNDTCYIGHTQISTSNQHGCVIQITSSNYFIKFAQTYGWWLVNRSTGSAEHADYADWKVQLLLYA